MKDHDPADSGIADTGRTDSGIAFSDSGDGATLGSYLERLLSLDKTAAVRVVGVGGVMAAYCAPPLHGSASRGATVLALKTMALASTVLASTARKSTALAAPSGSVQSGASATRPPSFDRTVAAGRLLDAISADWSSFTLPDALLGGPTWAGLLPPRTGWNPLGTLPVRQLADAVAQGNADFRFAALGRDRAGLDALAEEIWTRELAHGVRWRAAHAASVLAFLGPRPQQAGPEVVARISAHTRWLRVDAPFGTVLERTNPDAVTA